MNSKEYSLLQYINEHSLNPQVIRDIEDLVEAQPPLGEFEEMVVFRGQRNRHELRKDRWFSTTMNPNIALNEFMDERPCCLFQIHIKPGIKVLPVYEVTGSRFADESEVIVQGRQGIKVMDSFINKTGKKVYIIEYYPINNTRTPSISFDKRILSILNPDDIDESLEIMEMAPTKQNRLSEMRDIYEYHRQKDKKLPVLSEADYKRLYTSIF